MCNWVLVALTEGSSLCRIPPTPELLNSTEVAIGLLPLVRPPEAWELWVSSEANYARDVDADFSGKIDLADLSVLDADWAKTLHTGDQDFQGSTDVSWFELDSQGESSTWENDSLL